LIHGLTYFRGSVRIGQGESYLGQNPSSIPRMMLEYALCLVVADTPLAGNENHSRRAHVMQMARVMTGTGGHIHARNLQGSCGRPDGLTDCKREFEGRVVEQFVHRYCASSGGVPANLADCVSELAQSCRVRMAQIEREHNARGNNRRHIGAHVEHADGEPHHVFIIPERFVQGTHDVHGRDERVTSHAAGRGPGMVLLPGDFNPKRPLTLYSCNDTDRLSFELEDWTLLDMGLNERGRLCSERPARDP